MRLDAAAGRALDRRRERLTALSIALRTLNPAAVLDRGYAIVTDGRGILPGVGALTPGDVVQVEMANGAFEAQVTGIMPREAKR